ncbi:hypothetical protein GF327_01270 [Candidatus Woesearchaeota archaeon]|nr:hypothetical protein [Candidatus Woesearchaeota archaeon]
MSTLDGLEKLLGKSTYSQNNSNILFTIIGAVILIVGIYILNYIFKWYEFDLNISEEYLLIASSIGCIIGGLYIAFKNL